MAQFIVDKNALLYIFTKIKTFFVAKETGKGLSANDFSDDAKTKLDGIEAGAQKNVQPDWNAASGAGAIQNKPTIPSKTSQLTNDSGYITAEDVPDGAAASSTMPKMAGEAAVGQETTFARGDHQHPSDTSRVPTTRTVCGKALDSDVQLAAGDVDAIPTSQKGAANGICPLNANGMIDSAYLPGAVDNIDEGYFYNGKFYTDEAHTQEIPGRAETIFYDLSSGFSYRWGGTAFVKISSGDTVPISNEEIEQLFADA